MNDWGPGLAALLGLVEGLTEFLPVSSTGHLILVGALLGFTGAIATSVDISIQLGSILAIIAYERRKLARLLSQALLEQRELRTLLREGAGPEASSLVAACRAALPRSMERHRNLWFLAGLAIAFLPAAAVGFLAHGWIETYLFNPRTVAGALIGGGVIILLVEARRNPGRMTDLDQVRLPAAFAIGLAQCASLFPGVSRSGATIVGGLLAGLDRKVATEYSFFLALPTMIVATSYKMLKSRDLFSQSDVLSLALGLVVAFLVAWGVIAAFLAFVKRHSLRVFAYYRILLGLVVLAVLR